jgi:hypothetical protein
MLTVTMYMPGLLREEPSAKERGNDIMRRSLVECVCCTAPIYYYAAASVDRNVACADCLCKQDTTITEDEYQAKLREQTGPFHRKIARYVARKAG